MGTNEKKRILSGIQPTGIFTLGNYMGAVRNWVNMQNQPESFDCAYFIANQHALTVRMDPKELREGTLSAFALLVACGLDPDKNLMFVQSQVPAHSQALWIALCNVGFGELSRMTQFKDKSQKHPENVNAGLFSYPALMAMDILLYQSDLVPVGEDQKQHLEITRDIAERFNRIYGEVLKVPEPYIPKQGARIMSLLDPKKKMSKSDENPKATIFILEEPDKIIKKFKSAVTDSEASVHYAEGKDGINNLMTIYSCVTGKNYDQIESEFQGKGYGNFKTAVGESVAELLAPVRERYKELMSDKGELLKICDAGAIRAEEIAHQTLHKIYDSVGLLI